MIDSKAVIILTLRGRRLVTDHKKGARVASMSCLAARIGPKGPCQFELSIRGCSQSYNIRWDYVPTQNSDDGNQDEYTMLSTSD